MAKCPGLPCTRPRRGGVRRPRGATDDATRVVVAPSPPPSHRTSPYSARGTSISGGRIPPLPPPPPPAREVLRASPLARAQRENDGGPSLPTTPRARRVAHAAGKDVGAHPRRRPTATDASPPPQLPKPPSHEAARRTDGRGTSTSTLPPPHPPTRPATRPPSLPPTSHLHPPTLLWTVSAAGKTGAAPIAAAAGRRPAPASVGGARTGLVFGGTAGWPAPPPPPDPSLTSRDRRGERWRPGGGGGGSHRGGGPPQRACARAANISTMAEVVAWWAPPPRPPLRLHWCCCPPSRRSRAPTPPPPSRPLCPPSLPLSPTARLLASGRAPRPDRVNGHAARGEGGGRRAGRWSVSSPRGGRGGGKECAPGGQKGG